MLSFEFAGEASLMLGEAGVDLSLLRAGLVWSKNPRRLMMISPIFFAWPYSSSRLVVYPLIADVLR